MSLPRKFAFAFPTAAGHINPSFVIARSLVELGHEVHYLCTEAMRGPIEGTGATFHSAVQYQSEMFSDPSADAFKTVISMLKEHGLEPNLTNYQTYLRNVSLERKLPGALRFLQHIGADAIVYCPLVIREASVAAKILGIPGIALNTVAGPGALPHSLRAMCDEIHVKPEQLIKATQEFAPELAATKRLNDQYQLCLQPGLPMPLGLEDTFAYASLHMVTTCEDLQDTLSAELVDTYQEMGAHFFAVGPLLDREGTQRAGTCQPQDASQAESSADDVVTRARAAKAKGRPIVLVSMGTVITGNMPGVGWHSRPIGADGKEAGLTGRELCQAVWAAAFDAFGAVDADAGPLLVVSVGAQDDALGDVQPPPNVLCSKTIPQVDLLNVGVDLFLTHGGQNSFTESLMHGTPVVVCPGFGDQPMNATKAVSLGVGLKVDRPSPAAGAEAEAAFVYRREVSKALLEVWGKPCFAEAARSCSKRLQTAGGAPRAVQLVLDAVKQQEEKMGRNQELLMSCASSGGA